MNIYIYIIYTYISTIVGPKKLPLVIHNKDS